MKEGAEASIAKYDGEWNIEPLEKDPLTGEYRKTVLEENISLRLIYKLIFYVKWVMVSYEFKFIESFEKEKKDIDKGNEKK